MATPDTVAYHALSERKLIESLLADVRRLDDKLSALGYLDEARALRIGTLARLSDKLNTLNATITEADTP